MTGEERKNINIGDIYITRLDGKDYYHLKELEDGDFIAIDTSNHIFEITHDPFEIKNLDRQLLIDILKS